MLILSVPDGHNYFWQMSLISINFFFDGLIAITFFAIAFKMYQIKRQEEDSLLKYILSSAIAYTISFAITHFLESINIYWGEVSKVITACISVFVMIEFYRLAEPTVKAIRLSKFLSNSKNLANARNDLFLLSGNMNEIRAYFDDLVSLIELYDINLYRKPTKAEVKELFEETEKALIDQDMVKQVIASNVVTKYKVEIDYENMYADFEKLFNTQQKALTRVIALIDEVHKKQVNSQ
jgi:hypothetical protein